MRRAAMQHPEICRTQAMKCVLLAREADDFSYKLFLLSIAQVWGAIAETSETVQGLANRKVAAAIAA